jgi:hypothetical protein
MEQLRHHYEVEKALAARLRAAPREQRLHMLTGLYEQLFREVPDHPRRTRRHSPEDSRRHIVAQMRLLRRFLRPAMTVLEIGPGDCAFSFEIAKSVRQVYGVDVDAALSRNAQAPGNFRLFLSDGVSVPVPPGSVHLAYSRRTRANSCATFSPPSRRAASTCASRPIGSTGRTTYRAVSPKSPRAFT